MIDSKHRNSNRRGAALALFALSLLALVAFMALAIDIGMIAVARTQCQEAADASAMAGARTLNGMTNNNANNNYSNASPNAISIATTNAILGTAIQNNQVDVRVGRYVYVANQQRFEGQFPGPSTENWSMVQSTVTAPVTTKLAFSRVFNLTPSNIQAVATAAHRPRDVSIVLDYSGSMRFGSLVGDGPFDNPRSSNNADGVIPTFGHYSSTSSAALQATNFTLPYIASNITASTSDGRPAIALDFYTDTNGTRAFYPEAASLGATPTGDNFLKSNKNTGASYAQTAKDIVFPTTPVTNSTRDATFESQGFAAYNMKVGGSVGYTLGPGYWGKTFFMWPPDPIPSNDWRKKYFYYPGNYSQRMDDNARLWSTTSGGWKAPSSSTYSIDYTKILEFIKSTGPNPFPSRLQSGRILYYDSIPDSITGTTPTDLNQRFWKDYIDYVLGLVQEGSSWQVLNDDNDGLTGYGEDYTWGTVKITAKSSLSGSGNNPPPYMHYQDNPKRPRLHFWFGPLSMIDFLGNYNMWGQVSPANSRFCWWPGTCHESPLYACKLGIRAALTDISTNHPNDLVSMIMFSTPQESNGDGGRFNRARVGLSRNYDNMQESLWYPPRTIGSSGSTVRPYDSDNLEIPRAMGGTCYAMPLMLAFNQFSGNTSLQTYNPGAPTGDAGGMGRRGAQKIVIFETDGAPNTTATASFVNGGPQQSYYRVRYNSSNPGSSEFPSSVNGYSDNASTVTSQINTLCTQLAALESATPAGYSTPAKKALIHCIGFGPVFDPGSSGQAAAVATLNQMQTIGNVTDGMPSYKIIYGSETDMVNDLQEAFTRILQSGVQVSLIH